MSYCIESLLQHEGNVDLACRDLICQLISDDVDYDLMVSSFLEIIYILQTISLWETKTIFNIIFKYIYIQIYIYIYIYIYLYMFYNKFK